MQDLFSPSKWTATQKLTVSFLVVILTGAFSSGCLFPTSQELIKLI